MIRQRLNEIDSTQELTLQQENITTRLLSDEKGNDSVKPQLSWGHLNEQCMPFRIVQKGIAQVRKDDWDGFCLRAEQQHAAVRGFEDHVLNTAETAVD